MEKYNTGVEQALLLLSISSTMLLFNSPSSRFLVLFCLPLLLATLLLFSISVAWASSPLLCFHYLVFQFETQKKKQRLKLCDGNQYLNLGRDATCFGSMVGKKSSTQMAKSERNSTVITEAYVYSSSACYYCCINSRAYYLIIIMPRGFLIVTFHSPNNISWTIQLLLRIIIVNNSV